MNQHPDAPGRNQYCGLCGQPSGEAAGGAGAQGWYYLAVRGTGCVLGLGSRELRGHRLLRNPVLWVFALTLTFER